MASASFLLVCTAWVDAGLEGSSVGRSPPCCFWKGCWPLDGSPVVVSLGAEDMVGLESVVVDDVDVDVGSVAESGEVKL